MNAPFSSSPTQSDKPLASTATTNRQHGSAPVTHSLEIWQLVKEFVIQDATSQASNYVESFDTRQQGE